MFFLSCTENTHHPYFCKATEMQRVHKLRRQEKQQIEDARIKATEFTNSYQTWQKERACANGSACLSPHRRVK